MQVQHTVYLLENDYSSYKQSMSPSITLKEKLHGKNISYRTKYDIFITIKVIFLSRVIRLLSQPHGIAGGGPREVKGYQPQVEQCLASLSNRRDHKSYDRQGTTHSRHFAFRPIQLNTGKLLNSSNFCFEQAVNRLTFSSIFLFPIYSAEFFNRKYKNITRLLH